MAIVDELRAQPASPDRNLLTEYQERRRALLSSRGLDVSGLSLDQMTSADDVFVFPNLVGPIYPGSAIVFRIRPNGLDPDSCIKGHVDARVASIRPARAKVGATLLSRVA